MVDRTIAVRLRAEVADFKRGMADAAKVVDKNVTSVDTLSNHVGLLGTALTGFAALAVTRFAQFDKQMSSVQASTRATGAELDSLRQAAIRAGADTAFSATEAAAGIEELAKAGVSTKDILGGGLTGALNLAAAGELEVADAAQIAAVALKQFKLDGSDVSHVADLLAAGAGKAVGSVSDMSQALNQAGLVAAGTGLSIEETTAGLSAFAAAGLIGSDAGTSFKTMLQVLSAPSATAKKQMDELGISAYDAQGNFVGLEGFAGQLQTALEDLTPAQRNSALATIFGTDAVRAANVLYSEGADGIRDWTAAVDEQGYAAEQARIANDNLIGDLERLGGSFDSVLIQSGSGANESLRSLVQGAEAVVDAVGEIPGPVLNATATIAGAGGLALIGVAGLSKLTVGFVEARDAAKSLGISTKTAGLLAGGLGAALGVGTLAFSLWAQEAANAKAQTEAYLTTLDELGQRTEATTERISTALAGDTISSAVDGARSYIDIADQMGIATEDLTGYILGEADARDRVTAAMDRYKAGESFWGSLVQDRNTQIGDLVRGLDSEAESLTDAEKAAAQKARADEAAGVATDDLAESTEGATGALQDNTEAIEENWQAQFDASGAVLSLRDAQNAAEAAYDDATKAIDDNGKTLNVTTEKGRANRAALDDIAASGWDLVDSMRATGASSSEVSGAMATTRERFIRTAQAMGASKAEARRLADELGLIPKNVSSKVDVDTGNALSEIDQVRRALAGVNSKTVSLVLNTVRNEGRNHGGYAVGGRLPGFPTGGRLPGKSPANPMHDNLLGVDGAGMPKVRVRSREWVVNEPAADYYGDGLMSAINSRAIPREAFSGLMGLASGGAVRQAARQVSSLRDRLRSARRGRASDAALERLEEQLEDARARLDRLREEAAELRTDLRRGNIRDSVSGGLSGALGVTDQLRDLASSGDVSRFGSRRLNNVAGSAEKALTSLYKQAERIDNRIESATDSLQKWQGIADGVSSSISGAFSLGDVSGGVNPWSGKEQQATGQQLLSASLAYQTKARNLVLKLRALQDAGYGTAILQEVAAQGVDGGVAMADALLSLSPADAKALQASQAAIGFYAGRAGIAATDDQVTAAARALEAAEAQGRMIDKNIDRWASKLGSAMARALGIKARASGGPVMAGSAYLVGENGPELRVEQSSGYVLNAAKTANVMGRGGPTYTFNITNIHPVSEPASVTTNRALATAASTGRF